MSKNNPLSMIGSHLSVAGGLHNALISAHELGMDCVQVFTKNQRQWKAPPLKAEQVRNWQDHLESFKPEHLVSHDSYLINLASPDEAMRGKSLALFAEELRRCEALGIAHLVTHPGAHMKEGEEAGLARVAAALDQLHRELPGLKVVTCLEVTAGQGTALGCKLEHLRWIIDHVEQPERVATCMDTAHLLAAGYDLTSAAGAKAVLAEIDDLLGLDRVHVWHVNDSKTPLGSRVDRHAHIGQGHVSTEAFATLLANPTVMATPKILETPKGKDEDGRDLDSVNIETLRSLLGAPRTKANASRRTSK